MIIVDTIRQIEPALAAGVGSGAATRVETAAGHTVLVDNHHALGPVWLSILAERRQSQAPVYLDVHDDSRRVTRLLLPILDRVNRLADREDGAEVELELSHAKHFLRRTHPDFERLHDLLAHARETRQPLLITEDDDTHELVSVQEAEADSLPKLRAAQPELAASVPGGVTMQRASELFNLVNQQTCAPANPAGSCIPFLFPDDGCWGRAHEMDRLITGAGADVAKVWIYGDLRVATKNSPACSVSWNYHVAVTVNVTGGGGSPAVYVLDPSIFSGPVPQADWRNIQGDAHAVFTSSDARVFYRSPDGSVMYDDDYSQTAAVLSTYRQKLMLRSAGPAGPPPYPCH